MKTTCVSLNLKRVLAVILFGTILSSCGPSSKDADKYGFNVYLTASELPKIEQEMDLNIFKSNSSNYGKTDCQETYQKLLLAIDKGLKNATETPAFDNDLEYKKAIEAYYNEYKSLADIQMKQMMDIIQKHKADTLTLIEADEYNNVLIDIVSKRNKLIENLNAESHKFSEKYKANVPKINYNAILSKEDAKNYYEKTVFATWDIDTKKHTFITTVIMGNKTKAQAEWNNLVKDIDKGLVEVKLLPVFDNADYKNQVIEFIEAYKKVANEELKQLGEDPSMASEDFIKKINSKLNLLLTKLEQADKKFADENSFTIKK